MIAAVSTTHLPSQFRFTVSILTFEDSFSAPWTPFAFVSMVRAPPSVAFIALVETLARRVIVLASPSFTLYRCHNFPSFSVLIKANLQFKKPSLPSLHPSAARPSSTFYEPWLSVPSSRKVWLYRDLSVLIKSQMESYPGSSRLENFSNERNIE
jgi:hypothetical protein